MPLFNLCRNLTSLVKLIVDDVKELTCLPDEIQKTILLFNIYLSQTVGSFVNCHIWRYHFNSLHSLELSNYDGLTSLPSGMPEHCWSLKVDKCNNLVSFPLHFGEVPSLSYLDI
ncbi:hypothetical protein H5410_050837 [Solanum commersonii]|uniref:Uncharacterized protein n=1 Tax=Solanum commersonii TaxID=4109 RepID=A0A9J5WWP6_SOLCO|nr:hypothetical protein H5410_050837 [Solanum commersonii]